MHGFRADLLNKAKPLHLTGCRGFWATIERTGSNRRVFKFYSPRKLLETFFGLHVIPAGFSFSGLVPLCA